MTPPAATPFQPERWSLLTHSTSPSWRPMEEAFAAGVFESELLPLMLSPTSAAVVPFAAMAVALPPAPLPPVPLAFRSVTLEALGVSHATTGARSHSSR